MKLQISDSFKHFFLVFKCSSAWPTAGWESSPGIPTLPVKAMPTFRISVFQSEKPSTYPLPPGSPVYPTERPWVFSWRPQGTQASESPSSWAGYFLTLLTTKKCLLSLCSALACSRADRSETRRFHFAFPVRFVLSPQLFLLSWFLYLRARRV